VTLGSVGEARGWEVAHDSVTGKRGSDSHVHGWGWGDGCLAQSVVGPMGPGDGPRSDSHSQIDNRTPLDPAKV
jgi:hypothetical protein